MHIPGLTYSLILVGQPTYLWPATNQNIRNRELLTRSRRIKSIQSKFTIAKKSKVELYFFCRLERKIE
ncbi:hypothetical protein DN752_18890 [Echinicola strongylocentroti]|uniref:Uncharacterized protein n=1 Tax=Echinicola strongylocentroti TaxID=1795355 RepID=A0A2Z4IM63_9BACT|nr:hypothetical protein DN752_18890 [Echinicola strongylocentroti]